MKSGIEYFPLDVELDTKFELIEAEFGLKGFAVVVKLLQRIYGQQGYYCEWTNEVALLFSKKIGLSESVVLEIVEASIRRGIFDKTLYEKYQVLTSNGIQKRYFEAVGRRKNVDVKSSYLLFCDIKNYNNVNISSENVNINGESVHILKQSKVEESKVEKSKVKESKVDIEASPTAKFIQPSIAEVAAYCTERNNGIDAQIFMDFYESKGWYVGKNKMKDWKACIRTWESRNNRGGNSNGGINASVQADSSNDRKTDWGIATLEL